MLDRYRQKGQGRESFVENVQSKARAFDRILASLRAKQARVYEISRTEDDLFLIFYASNTPFIQRNGVAKSKATTEWSAEFFRNKFSDVDITYQVMPRGARDCFLNPKKYAVSGTVDQFFEQTNIDEQRYITGYNKFLDTNGLRELWDDFVNDVPYVSFPHRSCTDACLWIGLLDTITPLHHDVTNILLVQFHGKKEVILVPPCEIYMLDNVIGVYSSFPREQNQLLLALRQAG